MRKRRVVGGEVVAGGLIYYVDNIKRSSINTIQVFRGGRVECICGWLRIPAVKPVYLHPVSRPSSGRAREEGYIMRTLGRTNNL